MYQSQREYSVFSVFLEMVRKTKVLLVFHFFNVWHRGDNFTLPLCLFSSWWSFMVTCHDRELTLTNLIPRKGYGRLRWWIENASGEAQLSCWKGDISVLPPVRTWPSMAAMLEGRQLFLTSCQDMAKHGCHGERSFACAVCGVDVCAVGQ